MQSAVATYEAAALALSSARMDQRIGDFVLSSLSTLSEGSPAQRD